MTREEAIKELRHISDDMRGNWKRAICMGILALAQEPCEDSISRQAIIDIIESWLSCDAYNEAERHIMRAVLNILYELPSVSPQPKIGHWIPTYGNVKCSVCGSVKDSRDVGKATHYCDFCGAKMVESPESEGKE